VLYYFAPLEGITNSIYRNAFHNFFHPMDKYFTPFFVPSQRGLSSKDLKELLPDQNEGLYLVPQLLTNRSEHFIRAAQQLQGLGYQEVNLNLGCPSGTVVSKKRGAGFLTDPSELERFLDEIFSVSDLGISIKTRIGLKSADEFEVLLELFNAYPLSELIIHPRIQTDYYRDRPNLEVYRSALSESKHPVVYSGDLFTAKQVHTFHASFPQTKALMLGRGLIANPGLMEQVALGTPLTKEKLWAFHEYLYLRYQEVLFGTKPLLHKMKELWHYMICLFRESSKHAKRLRKAQTTLEYEAAVSAIFRDLSLLEEAGYVPPHETAQH
jgi:tRNA-dihydrouridine synthase